LDWAPATPSSVNTDGRSGVVGYSAEGTPAPMRAFHTPQPAARHRRNTWHFGTIDLPKRLGHPSLSVRHPSVARQRIANVEEPEFGGTFRSDDLCGLVACDLRPERAIWASAADAQP
jgi:hypothetical protein